MKLRTQFRLTLVLFGLLLLLIAASVIITGRQVAWLAAQEDTAHDLERAAGDLSYLSNDYLLYHESPLRTRWESRFTSFSQDLTKLTANGAEEQALLADIKANQQRLRAVFDDVAAVDGATLTPDALANPAWLQVSWSRLQVQAQGIISDAAQLSQLLDDEGNRWRQANLILILSLIGVFGAYFLVNSYLVQRRTLSALAELQASTASIGAGHLDVTLADQRADEIGDLARSFSRMAADLKGVTASKVDLEREIVERQRAEALLQGTNSALRRERDLLQAVMNGAKNSHLVFLDRDFNFVRVNKTYADTCGYTPEAMIGLNHFALYPHAENEAIFARVRDSGEPVEFHDKPFEFPDQPQRGVTYWDWTLTPVKDLTGCVEGLVFSLHETTARKRAEEEMRNLAKFPSENPNPVLRVSAQGILLYANQASAPLLDDWGVAVGAAVPEFWRTVVTQVLAAYEDRTIDVDVWGRVYSIFVAPVVESGYVNLYGRDTTARKLAEDNIRKLNRDLEIQAEELQAANISLEQQTEELQVANVQFEEQAEELRVANTNIEETLSREQMARAESEARQRTLEQREQALREALSEIERLNRDLGQRAAELEGANKELEAFAYSVSHDLRTPLASLENFARLLAETCDEQLSQEGRTYLRLVRENVSAMSRLIEGLLAFSRTARQPLKKQTIHPTEMVRQVVAEMCSAQGDRPRDIVIGDLPDCKADPLLIKQVWVNLVSNALKFSRPREMPRIEIGYRDVDERIVYFVKDNGVGFDVKQAETLFGVFQRFHSEEEFEGNGVGLAIVERIIKRHGGRVWAEGEVGKGATFYFSLS